jgi:hypothetical protein
LINFNIYIINQILLMNFIFIFMILLFLNYLNLILNYLDFYLLLLIIFLLFRKFGILIANELREVMGGLVKVMSLVLVACTVLMGHFCSLSDRISKLQLFC